MNPLSHAEYARASRIGRPIVQELGNGKYIVMVVQPDYMLTFEKEQTPAVHAILATPQLLFDDRTCTRKDRIAALMFLVKTVHCGAQTMLGTVSRDIPVTSTMEMWNVLLSRGMITTNTTEQRVKTIPYLKQIVGSFSSHFSPSDSILEIGSAATDEDGNSFLMRLLPEEVRRLITPSDINPKEKEISKSSNVRVINACELATHFPPKSLTKVICANVLETLTIDRLLTTLTAIEQTLTDNGLLIQLSDQPPYPNTIAHHYCTPTRVCFPLLDDPDNFGVQVIDKQAFIRFVKENNELLPIEREFLNWYANELPLYIDVMVTTWLERGGDLTAAKFISKWIADMQIDEMKVVRRNEFFKTMINDTLQQAGLEPVVHKTLAMTTREGNRMIRNATVRVLIAKKRSPAP